MVGVLAEMRAELARSGLRLGQVAVQLGVDESTVSRYLNGSRGMPEGFPERFAEAIRSAARLYADHLLSVADGATVAKTAPDEDREPAEVLA
jgi:predicted transcriptional regulator